MRNKQPPTRITLTQYIRRFGAEAEALKRAYCDIFGLWRSCPFKPCRRHRACAGDCSVCLKRGMASVPREVQWRARQRLIRATPESAGPPERTARECMPVALFELEAQRERQRLSGPAK
jgi:hypothetical protein